MLQKTCGQIAHWFLYELGLPVTMQAFALLSGRDPWGCAVSKRTPKNGRLLHANDVNDVPVREKGSRSSHLLTWQHKVHD